MNIRFIGDVHGKMEHYQNIIKESESSIQVGDFGMGFVNFPEIPKNHRFIRGNHDNPKLCTEHPNWINDGYYENNIFFVGGARSTDQEYRTPGFDWWPEEELNFVQMEDILTTYEKLKPKIVVTHAAPISIVKQLFNSLYTSNTETFLEELLLVHKPKYWIFGHYHISFRKIIQNVNFVGLNELEYFDLKL